MVAASRSRSRPCRQAQRQGLRSKTAFTPGRFVTIRNTGSVVRSVSLSKVGKGPLSKLCPSFNRRLAANLPIRRLIPSSCGIQRPTCMPPIEYFFPWLNCALERQGGRSPGEGLHLAPPQSLKMMEPLVSTSKDLSVLKEGACVARLVWASVPYCGCAGRS
jgi:hypothetical protein